MQKKIKIDHGRAFDWGRTSSDYAKYRDIYPKAFYQKLLDHGLCVKGQSVLDLGTGTGVLPRSLCAHGAEFTGVDISQNQIEHAVALARKEHLNIRFQCSPAEQCHFPDGSFDVVTACQCFTYFHQEALAPRLYRFLKPSGKFAVLYMAWLPFEDEIARKSEELILKYNPAWTGCGEKRHPIRVPEIYQQYFSVESEEVFDLHVPFTRDGWHGRILTCRGVEASLSAQEIERFDCEHRALLNEIAPQSFEILHYAAITILAKSGTHRQELI